MTCDYCTRPAEVMSAHATNEPLCRPCARNHYGTLPGNVRKITDADRTAHPRNESH